MAQPTPAFTGDELAFAHELWRYDYRDGSGRSVTFTESGGGHFYEGSPNGNPAGATAHPNELLNAGRTVPPPNAVPVPTTRQWISDLTATFLRDAFGYVIALPSTVNTAHSMLDDASGLLLVQGRPGALNDTITVSVINGRVRTQVASTVGSYSAVEWFPAASVSRIVIAGNGGTDTISFPGLTSMVTLVDYVVSTNQDANETGSITDGVVDLSTLVPGGQVSLRAAVVEANARLGNQAIYVAPNPGGYPLTLTGAEATASATVNDLDITGNLLIVGAGAGRTVIDPSWVGTPAAASNRVFEVVGSGVRLDLVGVTLAGSQNTAPQGGAAVLVQNQAILDVSDAAVVSNVGAAIVSTGGNVTVRRSVFTNNQETDGAAIDATAGSLTIGESIFARNTSTGGAGTTPNVKAATGVTKLNQGGNLHDNAPGGFFNGANTTVAPGAVADVLGTPDFVVTSVADTFDHTDDASALSIREAIDLANAPGASTVWLPAWTFRLTRDRAAYGRGSLTDTSVAFGDLDIAQTTTIRGVGATAGAVTRVAWRAGVIDRAFELLGDYNGDGVAGGGGAVNAADYTIWRDQLGSTNGLETFSADGDDDGDVDQADYAIWVQYYGNTLSMFNVQSV
ncbi:MAG: hypothetical protein ACRCT8_13140 [Lacipirellulaceae bacterium]